jgi:hypothetical protein
MIRRTVVFALATGTLATVAFTGPVASERERLEQMERVAAKAAEREAFAKLYAMMQGATPTERA